MVGENLNAELNSNPVAAQVQWCIVWLADGPIVPVTGPIFSIRATNTTALTPNVWTVGALTLPDDLPRGRYQVVGLRYSGANPVAGRLVFVGGRWRPGCLGSDGFDVPDHPMFRYGQLGVWGEFEDIEPPQMEFLATVADASQIVTLDLIQVRAGPA